METVRSNPVRGEDTGTIIAQTPSSVAVGGGQGGGCFTEGATIQNQQMETLQSNPVRGEDTGTNTAIFYHPMKGLGMSGLHSLIG